MMYDRMATLTYADRPGSLTSAGRMVRFPMKVLFLDVDGVLNSGGVTEILEEDKLLRVARIRGATGCEIVVSSTWRCYPRRLNRLTDALWRLGIATEGCTPDRSRLEHGRFIREPRGWEIQDWLDFRPEVSRIAILDDAGDMAHLDPFLIRTDAAEGLTDEDADRCIQLLEGEQDAGAWAPGTEAEARGVAELFAG